MIIRAAFFLININYPVQVGKVPVQVYSLGVAATHKPVLELTGLKEVKEKNLQLLTTIVTML